MMVMVIATRFAVPFMSSSRVWGMWLGGEEEDAVHLSSCGMACGWRSGPQYGEATFVV
eukprot:Nitzschia sp. Nitz4//scaffold382_size14485//11658//11908//NITZ4_008939-RA/size14485-est2genome-gene-0.16-mRNA-1//1//CDS//3329549926//8138//frame0